MGEVEYKANFNWDITKRKLVIFLPSFKYSELTEFSISQIQTKVDPSEWIIIIGNDNVDINWDHLRDKNVRYFTLLRDDKKSRNSCYIRNFAIKRAKSKLFMQKDAEVVVLGDFICNILYSHLPWRSGKIYSLNEKQTELYLKTADIKSTIATYPTLFCNGKLDYSALKMYSDIYNTTDPSEIPFSNFFTIAPVLKDTLLHMKKVILDADGQWNPSSYFQYIFGIGTKILQGIRGYDEDYTSYGWEDTDLFCRLYGMNQYLYPDYSCTAIHPYHPRGNEHEEEVVVKMKKVFISKNPEAFQRNPIKWGGGF